MALQQSYVLKGIPVSSSYLKITSFSVRETGKDDQGNKLYSANILVNRYTDSTKEYDIDQVNITKEGIAESALHLPALYSLIKPHFTESIDM